MGDKSNNQKFTSISPYNNLDLMFKLSFKLKKKKESIFY